ALLNKFEESAASIAKRVGFDAGFLHENPYQAVYNFRLIFIGNGSTINFWKSGWSRDFSALLLAKGYAGGKRRGIGKLRKVLVVSRSKMWRWVFEILCLNIGEHLSSGSTCCAVPFFIQTQASNWRISWPLIRRRRTVA